MARHRLLVLTAFALMASLLAACAGNGSGGATEVTFGAMIPQSGVSASIGDEAQRGIAMALEKTNVNGVKLSPQYLDNPSAPETAVTNLNKLNSVYHVPFSFTTFSSATKAVAPLAANHHIVLLNAGAITTEFENLSPYLFSDIPLGDAQSFVMLDYAAKKLGVHSLAAVYSNDAQGQGFRAVVPKFWQRRGGTYAGDVTVSTTQTDFGSTISKLQSMKADAVYLGTFGENVGDLLKQAASLNFKPAWLGSTSFANAGALKIAGSSAEGVYSSQVLAATDAAGQQFVKEYRAKYHSEPTSFVELSYSGVQILAQAVRDLRDAKQTVNGQNLRARMLSDTFHTINGDIQFRKDGSALLPIEVTKYSGGNFAPVTTTPANQVGELLR